MQIRTARTTSTPTHSATKGRVMNDKLSRAGLAFLLLVGAGVATGCDREDRQDVRNVDNEIDGEGGEGGEGGDD